MEINMTINESLYTKEGEKPLDNMVGAYSTTSIFRTMAFIGDSLSSGEFEVEHPDGTKSYHDMYEYSHGQFLARRNGLTAYNFSRGGMTAWEYMTSFAEEQGFFNPELRAHAYVIALGVNDLGRMLPLGTKDDFGTEGDSFAAYYSAIITKYREISPDAKFFLVGLPRQDSWRGNERVDIINSIIKKLARRNPNAYYIDLYTYGPYIDEKFKSIYYYNNHLNPMGYLLFAQIFDSYIDYIIRHNPEDFKTVGFINSGIKYKFD